MYSPTIPNTRDSRVGRRRTHIGRLAAIVGATSVVLAGCSGAQSSEEATGTPAPKTVTVTAESSAAATPESSTATTTVTAEQSSSPTQVDCSPSSVPVASDAAGIAPPLPGETWSVWQTGNLCGTLGYAELATTGGTGSSPTQLLLYNNGKFLGTGIKCNALGQVSGSTDESVTVQYRWPQGMDSNANMTGRASVTFAWNGSSVDMLGNLPAEATPGC